MKEPCPPGVADLVEGFTDLVKGVVDELAQSASAFAAALALVQTDNDRLRMQRDEARALIEALLERLSRTRPVIDAIAKTAGTDLPPKYLMVPCKNCHEPFPRVTKSRHVCDRCRSEVARRNVGVAHAARLAKRGTP